MTTYLVTGGCGFIGSHIAEALVEQGYEKVRSHAGRGSRPGAFVEARLYRRILDRVFFNRSTIAI